MGELSLKDKKKLAEQLFVHNDMDGKEVAQQIGVTEKTISNWRTVGHWDNLRSAKTLTKDNLVRNLYEQAYLITERAKEANKTLTSAETDQLVKIATSIEKLDKKHSLQLVIQVFKNFNNYVKQVDLDFAKVLTDMQRKYLQTLIPND